MASRVNPRGFEGSSRELPCRSLPPQYVPNIKPEPRAPAPLEAPLTTPPSNITPLPRAGGASGKG